jgi:hypothetical protein
MIFGLVLPIIYFYIFINSYSNMSESKKMKLVWETNDT